MRLTRWLFLRLLALAYLCAFLSLAVQITGLVGSRGVLPVSEFLRAVDQADLGAGRFLSYPTLAWLSAGDGFLRFLCWGGVAASLAALIGPWPAPVFGALWAFYLSLVVAGQEFLAFQWDILLCETGFLAIFFAPRSEPSRLVHWLLRLLLFRLLFSSGLVKLARGDATWRNLTALQYHYETQPLPTPLGWYAHQLPAWFQKASTVALFGIELVVPFFLFGPPRIRRWAVGLIAFLQALIVLTGNYAFFNLLTLALCAAALDDSFWGRILPARLAQRLPSEKKRTRAGRAAALALAMVIVPAGAVQVAGLVWGLTWLPRRVQRLSLRLAQAHLVGRYGLFAVMTTSRPEIVIEGSNDGETWLAYEFKYKPGDLERPPPIVAPHQPRLDWQMWFAALNVYRSTPWFTNLMVRLLEGSPQVLALLAKNPFPDSPPRYVRASRYDYHFSDFAIRRAEGAWWRRTFTGLYFPVASLRRP